MTVTRNIIFHEYIKLRSVPSSYFIVVIMIIAGAVLPPVAGFSLMWTLFFVTTSLFSWDERYGSEYLLGSLPITRRQIAISKFLFLILTLIIVTLFFALFYYFQRILLPWITVMPLNTIITYCLVFGGLYVALSVPNTLYFGSRKGMWVNLILYIVGFSAYNMMGDTTSVFISPDFFTSAAMIAATVLLAFVSLLICIKIYEHKEYKD